MECPFCHYHTTSEYNISLHVETSHPEFDQESPFAITDDDSLLLARALQQEDQEVLNGSKLDGDSHRLALSLSENEPSIDDCGYVVCPVCKDYVFLPDYADHLEIHASLNDLSSIDTIATMIRSGPGCSTDPQHSLGRKRGSGLQSSHNIVQSAEKRKHRPTLTRTMSSSIQKYSRDENVLVNSPSTPNKNRVRLGVSASPLSSSYHSNISLKADKLLREAWLLIQALEEGTRSFCIRRADAKETLLPIRAGRTDQACQQNWP